ncbi:PfaB family protein [Kitasatospora sp. MAP12-15]|uniref:beta-ketoacyl synthase N-terminal-like domain-containing protein n=1 Tax=unclassified Kitasatospora TaxID=2633591 RepID=UPI002476020A|nr:beta-ketoacyl synthase N-terminal-like domain-containing protein [Kitasatospora sp. MAP12-44]MDH6111060.1 PfaB family protein [Kitasatospora sp. MAP12-44]
MGNYAIVGLACLFPGAATPDEYWQNLVAGVDSRTEGGSRIFGHRPTVRETDPEDRHRIYCTRGGFLDSYSFDPAGYLLPADYLAGLDRSFHWALKTAADALSDAGDPQRAAGPARCGVVFGNYPFPTPASSRLTEPLWDTAVTAGLRAAGLPGGAASLPAPTGGPAAAHNLWAGGLPARVVAEALGLGGPQFTLDAACSSALYALKLACGYLEAGRADVMLAGGVCAPDPTVIHLSFSDLRAYPENGFSQPFDARSRGIITGQGAGMIAVKRLADAERDGDRVYAVIDAVALTNDGTGKHLLAPNATGQCGAYRLAYQQAGIDPSAVQYLECHATGTPLGDGTELTGVSDYFGAHGEVPLLGSVKANIGHLLTVAGLSSLLKVVLALAHGTLPPTLGVEQPLPGAAGERVVRAATPWPAGQVRRAGVSAFGFGGTNAHVVLSEPGARPAPASEPAEPAAMPTLSIIGMGAHFGPFTDLDALERAGYEGLDAFRELPEHRWRGFQEKLAGSDRAGYVESFEVDTVSYRIPPNDLEHFNQQHLLMTRVAEEALRDAGYRRPTAQDKGSTGRRVAVVLAMEMEPSAHGHGARYDLGRKLAQWCESAGVRPSPEQLAALTRVARNGIHDSIEPNEVLSYIGSIMASRISSLWNFTGPSFTLSADSASGACALDVARILLLDPTVEAVLVGGVDLAAGPESALARELLEPGGNGRPAGEGAGAVVVTRPELVPAGHTVYASLDGLAIGYPDSPSVLPEVRPELVARTAEAALAQAGLRPAEVELVEAGYAGIGRAGADELTGLARVWAGDGSGQLRTALSSAAATLGDTGCASVLAAVIRAALCLHHGYLPVASRPVAAELVERSAFFQPGESQPWLRADRESRRAAAVSVLGSAGTCAHLVLTGRTVRGERVGSDWARSGAPLVVPVGADGISQLVDRISWLKGRLESGADLGALVEESSDTAAAARLRVALVADDRAGLIRQLAQAARDLPEVHRTGGDWAAPSGSFFTSRPVGSGGKVALVFPGAFNSYLGLGSALFRAFPGLLPKFEEQTPRPAELLRAAALYPRTAVPADRRELMRLEGALIEDIPLMLAAGTSFALLATDLVRELLGIKVHGAFGYSLGESSMMFAMGGWAKGARNDVKISASPLFVDRLRGPKLTVRQLWSIPSEVPDNEVWGTHVVLAPVGEVRAKLPDFDRVFITHVNTPDEVVVAGDPAQCKDLIDALACRSARAPANHVMHCPVVDSALEELADLNRYPAGEVGDTVLYSSRHYAPIEEFGEEQIARNIAVTLRETVDFPRLVQAAYADGYRCFIEVGPSSTCARWVQETLGAAPHLSASVDRRGSRGVSDLARLVARLVSHGVPVDLGVFRPGPDAAAKPPGVRTFAVGGEPVAALVEAGAGALAATWPTGLPLIPEPEPALIPEPAPELVLVPAAGATTAAAAPLPPSVRPATTPAPRTAPAPVAQAAATETEPTMSQRPAAPPAPVVALVLEREPITMVPLAAVQLAGPPAPAPAVAPAVAIATAPEPAPWTGAAGTAAKPAAAPLSPAPTPRPSSVAELRRQMLAAHQEVLAGQHELRRQLTELLSAVAPTTTQLKPRPPKPEGVIWDEHDLLEFATGRVSAVFGEKFAEIDTFRRRVRLPAPPYHFATRVTKLDAEPGEFRPSFIRTEYDVPEDAWYAVDGQVPPAVAIEAGQCDLLLISYLGADFTNRGERVYRLLDSSLTFHGDLPQVGQTLRYDIWIDQFVRHGETMIFFFHYDCYADGKLILQLNNACAGFFTDEELESSLGIIEGTLRRKDADPAPDGITPSAFKPIAISERTTLSAADLALLAEGGIGEVFGPEHARPEGTNPSLRLPNELLRMVDEVTLLDRTGGGYGRGRIEAVKHLVPDGWYFDCHFSDDPVLAGSLVAEGAVQLLQTYAFSLGLHLALPDARFQPVPGLQTEVKVRGQITPDCAEIRYQLDITELSLLPRPTVVADVLVLRDGKPAISVRGLAIRLQEKPGTPFRPEAGGATPHFLGRRNRSGEPALLNEFHMAHAAKGDLAVAMGPEFEVYADSRAPYIPNGDFLFVDRVQALEGVRGAAKPGAVMVTEYDAHADSWYFAENGYPAMPNCVYMESSLQAAILLGYYLGATLDSPAEQYSIRNLDGRATLVKDVDLRGKTVRHHSTLLSNDAIPGAILQNYRYELSADGEVFYTGESLFGFFNEKALANQVGLDGGKHVPQWLDQQPARPAGLRRIELADYRAAEPGRGGAKLARGRLDLVEWMELVPDGGKHAAGYLRGHRSIRPEEWYFSCHFHRDPVMPGSLGVEAVLQAMQVYAVETGLTAGLADPHFALAAGVQTTWRYRGQILRTDPDMEFDVHIREVRREGGRIVLIGDASVWKSTLRIYELGGVSVEIRDGQ